MSERNQSHERTDGTLPIERRAVMGALAAGTGLAAIGSGTVTADEHNEANSDIHPIFGFSGESGDVDPPVEPDHEVVLHEDPPASEMMFPEWHFHPVGLYVEPGDTVQFTLESHFHTVTAYHPDMGFTQRVPDEVGPISSPVLWEAAYFLYTFEEPGVYDLLCLPHDWAGMVMRIVVGEATGPGAEEVDEPEYGEAYPDPENPVAPDWLAASILRDPAMDPENIIEQGEVSWHDDIADESKTLPMELLMPEGGQSLVAVLRGEGDVDTDAAGCAHFTPAEVGLAWDLVLEDIEGVTQAHVHEGERGEDGPVVAPMVAYTDDLEGEEGEPQDADEDDPLIEAGLIDDEDLIEDILQNPSGYYVNVHTTGNPAGEIRGQIRGRDHVDEEVEDDEVEDDDEIEDDEVEDDEVEDDEIEDDEVEDDEVEDDEIEDDEVEDDEVEDDDEIEDDEVEDDEIEDDEVEDDEIEDDEVEDDEIGDDGLADDTGNTTQNGG